jgi:hypothetical protein
LSIFFLEHDGEIILYETSSHLHWVFHEGSLDDVEFLTREKVVDSYGTTLVEGRVAFGKVGTEFFEEFDGAVEGFGFGVAAFGTAFEDAFGFVGVVFGVVVVEFWIC